MSHPASRMLAMLELLQTHHVLSGAQLAAMLAVDERTVRRYAVGLSELGIPVSASRGRYGGYRLTPGYKLPPLMLTDDEAVAVLLGLAAAERIGLATQAPATASAQAKIQRVLPAALADQVGAVRDSLGFTLRRRGDELRPATDVLLTLGSAVRDRRTVELGYQSFSGGASQRLLHPYGLVFHSGRWYVAGHDEKSADIRTFRVDRILSAALGDERFVAPEDFDPVAHVIRSLARVPYTHEVEVLFDADLAAVRARVPETVGPVVPTERGVLLRARAEKLDGMAVMLAGLGFAFTVLRPEALRTAVAGYAAQLASFAARVD